MPGGRGRVRSSARTTSQVVLAAVPALRWARVYRRADLRPDVSAGLTVAVLLIPQSMAYAALAGLPPQAGLYAAVVSLVVYAALGSSSFISVAPVAIDSLLVAAAVGPLADGDTGRYVALAATLALLTGVVQMTMGVLRLGALVNFLSVPVISGFTSAAALTIAASQVKDLLGLDTQGGGTGFLSTVQAAAAAWDTLHVATVLIAAASIVFLVVARHRAPRVPAALAAVAVGTVAVYLLGLDEGGVRILGEVPAGLPTPDLPLLSTEVVRQLVPAAVTIAVISYMESISTAKAFAARSRQRVLPNQELVAVGAANLAAGVFQGFSVAGGFSRGAVNFRAGARTQLSGVVAAIVLGAAVAFLTPAFFHLPKAVLAAVIVVAVASLVDVRGARQILRVQRADGIALAGTFLATLLLGVAQGLALGVALSMGLFVARTARPHVVEVGRVRGTARYRNVERWPTSTDPRVAVLRMDSPLYFANAGFLHDRIQSLVAERPALEHLLLVASAIGDVDASGAQLLAELEEELAAAGIQLHLVTVRGPVRDVLTNSGLWPRLVDSGRVHATVEAAVRAAAGSKPSGLVPEEGQAENSRGVV